MAEIYANNVRGTLAAPIAAADTSITLHPGHNFLDPGSHWFRATLYRWEFTGEGVREFDHEVVKVTARAGDVLTVERALEGASLAYDPDTPIELRMTAGTAGDIEGRATQALENHVADPDPHTQYAREVDLGEASTRGVVGGAGDVMARGYGGIGTGEGLSNAFISGQDFNSFTVSGLFFVGGYNNVNTPSGGSTTTTALIVSNNNTDNSRVFHDATERTPSGQVIKAHRYSGDGGLTWSAWNISYGRHNTVGTVSQSGGVPTGAIIERGSNSFGEYTKFADGTLICTKNFNTATTGSPAFGMTTGDIGSGTYDNPYRSNEFDLQLAADYVGTFSCVGSVLRNNSSDLNRMLKIIFRARSGSNKIVSCNVLSLSGGTSPGGFEVSLVVTGRWY